MLEKIPKSFIDELVLKTNIVDIVSSKIQIIKRGKNFYAICPFHNEKTPSFSISLEKQFYYCFGCNVHGNVIDFLMNYEKMSFLESIKELSMLNGMKIPTKNIKYKKQCEKIYYEKKKLHNILYKLSKKYINNIYEKKNVQVRKYLEKRGVRKDIIEKFSIGYSNNIKIITDKYAKQNKTLVNLLIKAGILYLNKNNTIYNRFVNRIMFPIKNSKGEINGFGARILTKSFPKYLNSPETKIFKKKENLYGINEVYKYNKLIKKLLIVEGYFDVITLFQNKIKYAVSILGTSININIIKKLFKISNTIIYCYDGDKAGKNASWKTLEISLPYIEDNKILKFIFLPKGEDPDSIIRKEGYKNFKIRIKNATPMSEFLFKKLLKKNDLSSPEKKTTFSRLAINMIQKIPGKIIKFFLRKKLIKKLGITKHDQRCLLIPKKYIYKKKKK
ncbi:DNA primase [Buchnera aphidicola (Chaitoregma tattakana)]|uniref:DNA primase n=1 Tax=Buchnera aphidicola TaxID=9 RepID=UPI0031B87231